MKRLSLALLFIVLAGCAENDVGPPVDLPRSSEPQANHWQHSEPSESYFLDSA